MTTKKHTPGPWELVVDLPDSRYRSTRVVADGYGFSAPYRLKPGSGRDPQQEADNALIAAAPDLLAACEAAALVMTCTDRLGHMAPRRGCNCSRCRVALGLRAAIAKAKGDGEPFNVRAAIAKAKGGES